MPSDTLPALKGIHHLKLPVADLDRSLAFYEAVFGAKRIPQFDHRHEDGSLYAYILDIPGFGILVELRLNPAHAERQCEFDPFTLAVEDRTTLREWAARLDALGIARSKEITALQAWLLVFDDPDRHRLRLYTLETHGPELTPDADDPWLRN